MTSPIPRDPAGGVQATYQAALDDGRFRVQRCDECGHAVLHPRALCPHCGSGALSWFEPGGQGVVHAVTTMRRKPDAGGDDNVSLVDLDEGVRLMSRIEGLPPADVRIGQRVKARVALKDGVGVVVFDVQGASA